MTVLLLLKSGEELFFSYFFWSKVCDTIWSRTNCIDKNLQFVKIWVCPFKIKIFEGPDISLSECAIFLALCALGFYAFLFTWCFEELSNLCALVHPYFFGWFGAIMILNASAAVVAYFIFKGLQSEIAGHAVNGDKQILNIMLALDKFINIGKIWWPVLVDIINYDFQSRRFLADGSISCLSRFSAKEMFIFFARQIGCFYQVVHTTKKCGTFVTIF